MPLLPRRNRKRIRRDRIPCRDPSNGRSRSRTGTARFAWLPSPQGPVERLAGTSEILWYALKQRGTGRSRKCATAAWLAWVSLDYDSGDIRLRNSAIAEEDWGFVPAQVAPVNAGRNFTLPSRAAAAQCFSGPHSSDRCSMPRGQSACRTRCRAGPQKKGHSRIHSNSAA